MTRTTSTIARNALTTRAWDVLEERICAFEDDWARGAPLPLDHYLPQGDQTLQRTALVELVKVDLELQWKSGRRPTLHDYCRQYRQLGATETLPADLVYEAWWVIQQNGDTVSFEDFCEQFPRQRKALMALAQREVSVSTSIARRKPQLELSTGDTIDDFEIVGLLGEGAFARVYLARQLSLDRRVALKVSVNRGAEARTLASLEHDHIVAVYSETVETTHNVRLLCMQHVAGTTLADVIKRLRDLPHSQWSGQAVLTAIDESTQYPAEFHPTAFRDREALRHADLVETACRLGAQVAEALAVAHAQGKVHRDVKPANILINQYGRPMLADFNLSLDPHQLAGGAAGMFGGSVGYMSPEHLDAFNPDDPTPPEAVDARSDLYSLGVVLYELLTGQRPFDFQPTDVDACDFLCDMSSLLRSSPTPSPAERRPELSEGLCAVVQRCLEPDPKSRFQTAADVCEALEGARQWHAIEREMPPSPLLPLVKRHPFWFVFFAALTPHAVGGAMNIAYNWLEIVSSLDGAQRERFFHLVIAYNAVVFAIAFFAEPLIVGLARKACSRRNRGWRSSDALVAAARRRVAAWPVFAAALAALLWLPGAVIFPWALGVTPALYGHFLVSFVFSFLIASTYGFFMTELIATRAVYPWLLLGEPQPHVTARRELRGKRTMLRVFQAMAGVIPLMAAGLMIFVGPEGSSDRQYQMFRLWVTVMIALGGGGFMLAIYSANLFQDSLRVLTGNPSSR